MSLDKHIKAEREHQAFERKIQEHVRVIMERDYGITPHQQRRKELLKEIRHHLIIWVWLTGVVVTFGYFCHAEWNAPTGDPSQKLVNATMCSLLWPIVLTGRASILAWQD